MQSHYPCQQAPLALSAFVPLPLGSVKPRGWLRSQLQIQAGGLSGHLDEFWADVGPNSAWLGGTGENWERGPYFVDGLVPLAYLTGEPRLIAKAENWIHHILDSQQPDGSFGPTTNTDAWPRMVALKALTQYAEATADPRVPDFMLRYFRSQYDRPVDLPHGDWRGVRYAENVLSIYWLYNRTGEAWLLDLARRQIAAGFDWAGYFRRFPWRDKIHPFYFRHEHHVVNVAMGIKTPAVAFALLQDDSLRQVVYLGIERLDAYHGQVTGVFTGDEHLAGMEPTQGTELCAVVEYMFSLEQLLAILGDPAFGDRLEQIAYNALPATFTPDMWAHQYDQQVNQVLCTVDKRNWTNNTDDSNTYGLEPHFGCCTANFHQGWPKFVAHLWMATPDLGLAAIAYGPSEVTARVGEHGTSITLRTDTDYPFEGEIRLQIEADETVDFPLWLRIPGWVTDRVSATINGRPVDIPDASGWYPIRRVWSPGDHVVLSLPMPVRALTRNRNALSLARGPLVLALKIEEEFRQIKGEAPHADWAVHPRSAWNYGLAVDRALPEKSVQVITRAVGETPFHPQHAPVVALVPARRIPEWEMVANSAGPTPPSPWVSLEPLEQVALIPYGSTNLRIAEFPQVA